MALIGISVHLNIYCTKNRLKNIYIALMSILK